MQLQDLPPNVIAFPQHRIKPTEGGIPNPVAQLRQQGINPHNFGDYFLEDVEEGECDVHPDYNEEMEF